MTFKNKLEEAYWIGCIRHAEEMDRIKGATIAAKWKVVEYTDYADGMLLELRRRQKVNIIK